ncbi:MAG TPA: hypothetical protein VFS34_14410, partial [Thermoanaerobaculia bacterium]|nr:hypothetical protein [Thermoanaerobaculia bacterium]
MAADPNNAVFFPATLLFLVRPFSSGARAAHLLWAEAFALLSFAALRKLSLTRFSAAVCAFALAVSGPAMTLASLPTTAWSVALFLPLLSAWGAPSGVAGGALIFGLVILSGEPAIAGEVLFLALAFRLLERRGRWKAAAGAALAGAAMAMPQIAGAAGLIGDTVRRGGLAVASGAAFYSVRPLRFLAFVWPGLFGDVHAATANGFWGSAFFDAGTPYISTLAVGMATLALLPAAARRRRGRALLTLAAIAALLSLGRYLPGGDRLLSLPGLSLVRYPEKWLFFSAVCAIAAAGFGLDRVRSGDRVAIRRVAVAGASMAAASGIAALLVRLAPVRAWSAIVGSRIADGSLAPARSAILDAIGRELSTAAALSGVLFIAAAGFARRPRRLAGALALILLADLVPRTWNSVPLAPASQFDDPPEAVRAVAARGGRFYFDGETEVAADPLRPMAPTMAGVAFAGNNDIDRFSPRRSFLFGRAVASLPLSDPRKAGLLRLADVRSVSSISPPSAGLEPWFATSPYRTVYRLAGGERFRLFPAATSAAGEEEARALLVDPRRDPVADLV